MPTLDIIAAIGQGGALVVFCGILLKFHISSLKDTRAREKALTAEKALIAQALLDQAEAHRLELKEGRELCRVESEKLVSRIRALEDNSREQMHEVMNTCLETVRTMAEVQKNASGKHTAVDVAHPPKDL